MAAVIRCVHEVAIALVLGALSVSSAVAAEEEPTTAIWKAQEVSFTYFSSDAIYSCSALQGRVESVLRAVGADSIKVVVNGCREFFVPDASTTLRRGRFDSFDRFSNRLREPQVARITMRFRSPILATPEALAELEKTKGYRELLARVTGSSAVAQEAAAQFPVRRQQISLSHRTVGFEPEECQLVEQLSRQLFPKLGVRVLKQAVSCFPGQTSLLKPRLEVEALIRTPAEELNRQPPQDPIESPPQAAAQPEAADSSQTDSGQTAPIQTAPVQTDSPR